MAVREQRQFGISTTEPTIAWLRLFIVALTGMSLIAAGATNKLTSPVWLVILVAGVYAAINSGLGLYRRYRRFLSRKTYLAIDLILISLVVAWTGGVRSPVYPLYTLPLVVVVVHYGARQGALYTLAATIAYGAIAQFDADTSRTWLAHIGLLWALYLVLGYVITAEDDRDQRAQRRDELGALHRAAAAPVHTGDIPTVIENLLSGALVATNACWAGIFLYDDTDDRFTTGYTLGAGERDEPVRQESPLVTASDVLFTVLYTGQTTPLMDLHGDRRMRGSILSRDFIRSAIATPLLAPGGEKVGVLCLGYEDIRKPSQHELRLATLLGVQAAVAIRGAILFREAASLEAAKEADKLRTQLLGTVSHELRTPITAIQGFASSLRCAYEEDLEVSDEIIDDWVTEIEENAERLARIVSDLLDLSRLEAGALRMSFEWENFGDVVEDIRANLEILAGTRNLVVQAADSLPIVKCDAERTGQVLRNLVENAAKFSPPESNIVIGIERYENGIRVGVLDEGEGIPMEFQERIFERFFQVESASFRPQKGTGLGLAICRNIVEAHGGRIWVESAPGKGSIFYFTLQSPAGL